MIFKKDFEKFGDAEFHILFDTYKLLKSFDCRQEIFLSNLQS